MLNYVVGNVNIGNWSFPLNIFLTIAIGLIAGYAAAIVIFTFKEKNAKERAQQLSALLDRKAKQQKEISSNLTDAAACDTEPLLINSGERLGITPSQSEIVCSSTELGSTESGKKKRFKKSPTIRSTSSNRIVKMMSDKEFVKFTVIFGIQSFFMSFCWPLFPIRQRSDTVSYTHLTLPTN